MDFTTYLRSLQKDLSSGKATEHTYRPALKTLVESVQRGVRATNEPKREECGAPDFIVQRRDIPLGYIECKDIGKPLDEEEKSEQMERYRPALANLILTDYLEFRYYVQGERKLTARLGTVDRKGKIRPDAPGQADVSQLLDTFLAAEWPAINKPKDLAARMAKLAQLIRRTILAALDHESKRGKLHQQMKGFRDVLLHDLTEDQFADMYAQTICYGLFAAWCNTAPKEVDKFTREHAAYALPKTNPFLRSMFSHIAGPELPPSITWVVDDVAELLRRADIGAILKDFGKRTRREDPVVHFYETFLAEYDRKMRESRGVYYTPDPVVSYIVRSIDHILKTDFDVKDGLADASVIKKEFPIPGTDETETRDVHKVQILDPATGTGTFLYGVILQIYQTFSRNRGLWPGYVSKHLLPRLFGFELLMAPYAIAHMKLDLLLKDTGYDFPADERINVFLTNTLEEAEYRAGGLFAGLIAEEANQASRVKKDVPVMVVLGNPPYSAESVNKGSWITQLVKESYYPKDEIKEQNPKLILDDYVKFIRFGQYRIERTGYGILAFITNHGYLDNPTFRAMRHSLMQTFDEIYVLNLHGNTYKKEVSPDGSRDENVFDIMQGVAIAIFVKKPDTSAKAKSGVRYYDVWGKRSVLGSTTPGSLEGGKYHWLSRHDIGNTDWSLIAPREPFNLFIPSDQSKAPEYEVGWSITDIFINTSTGVKTHRDHFVISFDLAQLVERIERFRRMDLNDDILREEYKLKDTRDWKLSLRRKSLAKNSNWRDFLTLCHYRPFDLRPYFHHRDIVELPRSECTDHLLAGANVSLLWTRPLAPTYEFSVLLSKHVPHQCVVGNKMAGGGASYLAPLYLYPTASAKSQKKLLENITRWAPGKAGRCPNLGHEFAADFATRVGLEFLSDGKGDLKKTFGPEDILHYIYALFHSPTYRTRYAEFLKRDLPRLPLTSDRKLFARLCKLGAELVGLHLLERVPTPQATYPQQGSNVVERIGKKAYKPPTSQAPGRVYINDAQYFENVPPEVWEFQVGGYQVCEKWLKDRKGRELTFDDINHYRNVVTALSETIRLMAEIDKAIPKWPIE